MTKRRFGLVWSDLVWSGLEKALFLWLWSLGCNQQPFSCVRGNFGLVTNEQPGETRESLLLTSEKAVFCKKKERNVLVKKIWNLVGSLQDFIFSWPEYFYCQLASNLTFFAISLNISFIFQESDSSKLELTISLFCQKSEIFGSQIGKSSDCRLTSEGTSSKWFQMVGRVSHGTESCTSSRAW